jgi:hypothetical protein
MKRNSATSQSEELDNNQAAMRFKDFFSAVGYAITRWSYVNSSLFDFCYFSLDTTRDKAAIVFYRQKELGQKLQLVDQLMKQSLSPRMLKKWNEISKKTNELLPFRNFLAHEAPTQVHSGTFIVGEGPYEFQPPPPEAWWEIRTEESKLLSSKRESIQVKQEQVIAHIRMLNQLISEMWALEKALPKRPTKQPSKSAMRNVSSASPTRGKKLRNNAKR